jgi:hypothetical protein
MLKGILDATSICILGCHRFKRGNVSVPVFFQSLERYYAVIFKLYYPAAFFPSVGKEIDVFEQPVVVFDPNTG